MTGYHVTTKRKIEKYKSTGGILPPVRFWPSLETAEKWMRRVGRDKILKITFETSYPLPDHRPARWTPDIVRDYEILP